MNNNWELCPKCHGVQGVECHICDGTGLINSRTALPPIRQQKKAVPVEKPEVTTRHTSRDFMDLLRDAQEQQRKRDKESSDWIKKQILNGTASTFVGLGTTTRDARAVGMRDYTNQVETTKTEL